VILIARAGLRYYSPTSQDPGAPQPTSPSPGGATAPSATKSHNPRADLPARKSALAAGGDTGQIRLTDDGELIIPQLSAEDIPAEADELRDEMAGMLPKVPFASVLVEVDARTGFLDHMVHAGGKVNRPS
jgi:hypothetical protein